MLHTAPQPFNKNTALNEALWEKRIVLHGPPSKWAFSESLVLIVESDSDQAKMRPDPEPKPAENEESL